jgi:hypothetical protein
MVYSLSLRHLCPHTQPLGTRRLKHLLWAGSLEVVASWSFLWLQGPQEKQDSSPGRPGLSQAPSAKTNPKPKRQRLNITSAQRLCSTNQEPQQGARGSCLSP